MVFRAAYSEELVVGAMDFCPEIGEMRQWSAKLRAAMAARRQLTLINSSFARSKHYA